MKYYEIVRIANEGPDQETFQDIHKQARRGWYRKVVEYLSNWDYGDENLSAAISLNELRDNVLDSTGDSVLYEKGDYTLCKANDITGIYEAYYLVKAVNESEIENL